MSAYFLYILYQTTSAQMGIKLQRTYITSIYGCLSDVFAVQAPSSINPLGYFLISRYSLALCALLLNVRADDADNCASGTPCDPEMRYSWHVWTSVIKKYLNTETKTNK